MNIDNKVLAYLQWQGEAGTDQVASSIVASPKAVYMALRRLCLQGEVSKRRVRAQKTLGKVIKWKINKESEIKKGEANV